ncbi:malonyl-CoA decarboxylase domain-containing protein [Rhodobaculum claviforme]|uniref:Decarboxylase n=1 Tax=Rhodobaculum claviforme TaxID=1549854 RepID=A0A934WI48_9RHOB|nr:malonyl-CoA decarboxylase family protein [Rhodobaculum claviforme]MBK5926372.1 decarboxylase [Rhodobaculum claviforme]
MTRTGFLGDLLGQLVERRFVPARGGGDRPMEELCRNLMSGGGEVSTMRLARETLARYRGLDAAGRRAFFHMLADGFDVDAAAVAEAARDYGAARDAATLDRLVRRAEPARQELFRRLNHAPGATADLVRMRRDLLGLLPEAPDLARVDLDFAHLFASWFNRGFLVLRQITWESPARLLEKIIGYEAVHEIDDWEALRARIDPPDRRCFAFFHPAMPDEPLIFVQVALVKGLPGSVQALLDPGRAVLDPAGADTATFYSISNCQSGLKGISFGNSLIKQVVELLRQELPHLRTFVTLSPIPGLGPWLSENAASGDAAAARLLELARTPGATFDDPAALALRRAAARYLLEAKDGRDRPRDPVARFHLGNGAQVHEVHARADLSPRGLKQSCGAMVNYLYDPEAVEQNHEDYATRHSVAAARGVRSLARATGDWPGAERKTKADKETSRDGQPAP